MTYHNEDHGAFEQAQFEQRQREQKVVQYCDALVDSICSRIQQTISGATVEHIDLNAAPNERLLRVLCPSGIELWVDVSSPADMR